MSGAIACLIPPSCQRKRPIILSSPRYWLKAAIPYLSFSCRDSIVSLISDLPLCFSSWLRVDLSRSLFRNSVDFPQTQESILVLFIARYIFACVVDKKACSTREPRLMSGKTGNGTWWTSPMGRLGVGEGEKQGIARPRACGDTRTFESSTQSVSYFAARYERTRLLILGLVPTTSSPTESDSLGIYVSRTRLGRSGAPINRLAWTCGYLSMRVLTIRIAWSSSSATEKMISNLSTGYCCWKLDSRFS